MENRPGPNLTAILGFIGGVLGIPLSYFFQPGLVRAKMNLGDYLKAFPDLIAKLDKTPSEITFPAILTPLILAAIGALVGYLIKQSQSQSSPQRQTYSDSPHREPDTDYSPDSNNSTSKRVDRETGAVIEGYSLKIKNEPLNIELLYEFAEFLNNKGHHDKSIETLLKLVTIDKNNLQALKLLLKNYESRERYEDFTDTAKKIIDLQPSDKDTLLKLSETLFQQCKYEDSLSYIDSLIKIDPKNRDAWLLKSRASEKIDNVIQAVKSLYQAIKLDPSDVDNKIRLVEILSDNKEYDKILSVLKTITTHENNIHKILSSLYRSWCLIKTGETVDQVNKVLDQLDLADIEKADIKNSEIKAEILSFLASEKFSMNDFESALRLYKKAKDVHNSEYINQKVADCYNEIGNKHLSNAKLSEAYRCFKEGLEFESINVKLNSNLELVSKKLRKRKLVFGGSFATAGIILIACISIYYYGRQSFDITVQDSAVIKVLNGDNLIATTEGTNLKTNLLFYGNYRILVEKEGYEKNDVLEKVGFGRNFKKVELSLKPKYGILKIDSEPANAIVIVKNIYQRKEAITPCEISDVFALENEIEVAIKGFNSYKIKKEINKNETIELGKISFKGGLAIDSNPSGVEVYIDDKVAGVTPLKINSLPAKRIKVFARKENVGAYLSEVDIFPEKTIDLGKVTLSNLSFLRVNSAPKAAKVWIDRKEVGVTPLVLDNIDAGKHMLKVAHSDLLPYEKEINFRTGELIDLGTISFVGSLKVSTDPSGAKIFIDGDYKGVTPVTIDNILAKRSRIEIKVPDRGAYTSEVLINPGQIIDLGLIKISPWLGKSLLQNDKWKAEIKILSLEQGTTCGKIDFRQLRCGGDLVYLGPKDNGYLMDEKLKYGTCVKGCQIWVSSDGNYYKEICGNKVTGDGNLYYATTNETTYSPKESLKGIWEGQGVQNTGSRWSIRIALHSESYSIEYPSLSCGGVLELIQKSDSTMKFRERIKFGRSNCVDGGLVEVSNLSPTEASYVWYYPNGNKGATGKLVKIP